MRKEIHLPKRLKASKVELKKYAKELLKKGYTGSYIEELIK